MAADRLHHPPMPAAGFTLVEVMVALVIMAVMAAIGWQGVDGMVRSRDIAQQASERSLRLATVVAQWEQDLLALYDFPQAPALQFDGAVLRLMRRAEGGVQVVAWSVREGRWQRWSSRPTQRLAELTQAWETSQMLQGTEPGHLLLAEGVKSWQLYCWRGNGWSNCQSSGDLSASVVPITPVPAPPAAPAASGASAPPPPAVAAVRSRVQLPAGVRLQIELPEGNLLRDLVLAGTGGG